MNNFAENLLRGGITVGIVIDIGDDKINMIHVGEEIVQFDKSVFPNGVSLQDRVIVTKCFNHGTLHGAILPPRWNMR